ncbi:hypothetical protein EV191_1011410 [Tamaricihabitans halophyticus]|uniref:WXG100 family type VII secretion target n=1 Tax=Tamaricihabitans halophyticus TaxID=1262583 RepID=A0A4R2RDH4_9PSEU|nr:hypothetical protein [Tamaricihabitans halophyticus]TCP57455.1 hypothetical protein EV191_1011410 [Tamaricihabitans halophyticus]
MGEGFAVKPEHVAGYGVLVLDVRDQVDTIKEHIAEHGSAQNGYEGAVMELIKPAVDDYAEAASNRYSSYCHLLESCSQELTRAAWDYSGAEENEYKRFKDDGSSNPGRPQQLDGYEDFEDAESYPAETDPSTDLKAPKIKDPDIKSKVEEVGGILYGIDWVLRQVFDFSPVEAITDPIAGNWNALKASGEVLGESGDATEESLANLTGDSLKKLDEHWDGGAAQEFDIYIADLAAGVSSEGPLNRIIGSAYETFSDQIEKVAEFIVTKLKEKVDQIASKVATGWIPGVGWARVIEFIWECWDTFAAAKEMVENLLELAEALKELIEAAIDPFKKGQIEGVEQLGEAAKDIAVAADKFIEKYAEVTGAEKSGEQSAEDREKILKDLEEAHEFSKDFDDMHDSDFVRLPEDEYSVGEDAERDG